MISDKEATRISKFLSLVLRHQPEAIGLVLNEGGWVAVPDLLQQLSIHGHNISLADLQHVVATNSKKRFAFDESGTTIRASQGHSVDVDLGYEPSVPPAVLYHGTAERFVPSILEKGLIKGNRQHVHLSSEKDTAVTVGRRHGKPVAFEVAAGTMHEDGQPFFVSANGVWLTDAVPATYLSLLK